MQVKVKAVALMKAVCIRNEPNKARFWTAGIGTHIIATTKECTAEMKAGQEAAEGKAVEDGGAAAAAGAGAAVGSAAGEAGGVLQEASAAGGEAEALQLLRHCLVLLGILFSDDDRRDGISPETFKRAKEAGTDDRSGLRMLKPLFRACAPACVGESVGCVAELCWAIKCISVNDDICKQVAKSGGLSQALSLFSKHQKDPRVARYACMLLRAVANNDDNKQILCKNDSGLGLALVLASVERHLELVEVCEQALAALSNMALRQGDNCRCIAANDGVDMIINAMRRHPTVETVQRPACIALRNMCTHRTEELRQVILDCGAEPLIRAAWVAHRQTCHDVAFGALRDLGCNMKVGASARKD